MHILIHHRMTIYTVFFFNDTATTEIYTLSLHDALPILLLVRQPADGRHEHLSGCSALGKCLGVALFGDRAYDLTQVGVALARDRKSTRLNSSHLVISYAVFCLKKKK